MNAGFRRPKNPELGVDVAGTVTAVGANVTRFEIGDDVFGLARARSPSTPPRTRSASPPSPTP